MATTAGPAFGTGALRRGIEEHAAPTLLSLYADDAETRIVDRDSRPSHPKVLRDGRITDQIMVQAWDE
ncbi:hypothetical protein A8713_29575 [Streptomyces sp. SAT1]|uniref:hypothetical protein n=1 Tax=unclassified Streptomyces TaxID=2593676 RepID=UPI0007DD3C49|nr:hypothetical protein [Streptomyces sp. SAT1]ANH94810.1 hypothetical protein A8713_29575 [Streptomyces sp. SAT1]